MNVVVAAASTAAFFGPKGPYRIFGILSKRVALKVYLKTLEIGCELVINSSNGTSLNPPALFSHLTIPLKFVNIVRQGKKAHTRKYLYGQTLLMF